MAFPGESAAALRHSSMSEEHCGQSQQQMVTSRKAILEEQLSRLHIVL